MNLKKNAKLVFTSTIYFSTITTVTMLNIKQY